MYLAFAITQFPVIVASSSKGSTIMVFWIQLAPHYISSDYCLINLIIVLKDYNSMKTSIDITKLILKYLPEVKYSHNIFCSYTKIFK